MISVLDPSSLVGRSLVAELARRLPGEPLRLFHTLGRDEYLVADVGDEATLVAPFADPGELTGSRAVVVTTPLADTASLGLLAWLRGRTEVSLVDVSQPGIAGDSATTVLDALPGPLASRWYHLPDPGLVGPVRMVRALAPLVPEAATVFVTRPVSIHGEEALHELAAEAAARLSGARPPHVDHLPEPIAFDLAPVADAELFGLERQLAELLALPELALHVLDAGVFHGHTAAVTVRCRRPAGEEGARKLLRAAPGLELARRNARLHVSDVASLEGVLCGPPRVRGATVSAWLVADGLRTGAAEAAADLIVELTGRP